MGCSFLWKPAYCGPAVDIQGTSDRTNDYRRTVNLGASTNDDLEAQQIAVRV